MRLSFAGRNSEFEQLRTLYLQGRHVLIVGPPGIGKTGLLNEFRTRAPLLICKDTSKITSICSGLEQELGRKSSRAFGIRAETSLDGSKTYKLHLPPNIPAKDFWSIVVSDNQTRSMLQTDQRLPAVGSQKGAVANPDTSVDVYLGPTAPAGHEANWVQTIPGKGWNVLLRLYGPLQPWYGQTWRPGEIELTK